MVGFMALAPKQRKPWLAALFSFLCPGLGQLYNGNLKLALVAIPVAIVLSLAGTFWLSNTFAELLVALGAGFLVDTVFCRAGLPRSTQLPPAGAEKIPALVAFTRSTWP